VNQKIQRDWRLPLTMMLLRLWIQLKRTYYRSGLEPRRFPRCTLSIRVTRVGTGTFSYYHTLNISMGGVFLKSLEPLPVGSELKLRFCLFPDCPEVEVGGRVAWTRLPSSDPTRVPGMGVSFTKVDDEAAWALETFMKTRL